MLKKINIENYPVVIPVLLLVLLLGVAVAVRSCG